MIPLAMLLGSLIANFVQHKRGKSTICSTTRRRIPATVFIGLWAGFNAWFIPHWLIPRLRAKGWF